MGVPFFNFPLVGLKRSVIYFEPDNNIALFLCTFYKHYFIEIETVIFRKSHTGYYSGKKVEGINFLNGGVMHSM